MGTVPYSFIFTEGALDTARNLDRTPHCLVTGTGNPTGTAVLWFWKNVLTRAVKLKWRKTPCPDISFPSQNRIIHKVCFRQYKYHTAVTLPINTLQ